MTDWRYCGGEKCQRSATRLYRSADGAIGMVKRWRGSVRTVRYFVWSLSDAAPEYDTEADARRAARTLPTSPNQPGVKR